MATLWKTETDSPLKNSQHRNMGPTPLVFIPGILKAPGIKILTKDAQSPGTLLECSKDAMCSLGSGSSGKARKRIQVSAKVTTIITKSLHY